MSQLEIVAMRPEDEDELLRFYRDELREWELFQGLWAWRNKAPVGEGRESFVIARLEGAILGSVGVVPVQVSLGGRRLQAAWQQDSLVSSRARGHGVGKSLVQRAADGWDITLAKGTSEAMYGLRKKNGYVDVPGSNCMVRVLRPRRLQRTRKQWAREMALWLFGRLQTGLFPTRPRSWQELSRFEEAFDVLSDRLPSDQVLSPVKSSSYLNWRYFGCPGRRYFVMGDPVLPAAVVVTASTRTPGEGWIVDLISDRGARSTNRALLAAGVKVLADKGVERIWAFATLPKARRWLRHLGFVSVPVTPRFTVRPAPAFHIPTPLTADFWHGDGDVELYV